jgi:hypothetical protein
MVNTRILCVEISIDATPGPSQNLSLATGLKEKNYFQMVKIHFSGASLIPSRTHNAAWREREGN